MNFGLPDDVLKKIRAVFPSFPEVKEVLLYGSRAKGNYRPGSDIDLAIRGGAIDLGTLNRIRSALEALHTPYTFDVLILEHVQTPELIEHIERAGKVFYARY